MNRHVLAALFLVGVVLLTVPFLLMQHSGAANASITAGFMLPLDHKIHCICILAIGGIAAWFAGEMLVLLPVSALLMLTLGALSLIDRDTFPQVQDFSVGAILLFSMTVAMMRHKFSIPSVIPIAIWAYFAGGSYIAAMSEGTQPLYFLLGFVQSAALLLAIGVALAITLTGVIRASFGQLKTVTAIASFFGFL